MARPPKGDGDKRTLIVRFRLTASEKKRLSDHAAQAGLTPSDFIRHRTLGSRPETQKATPDREVFIRGLGELGKIGSNVNQIARSLNRREDVSSVSLELIEHALHGIRTLTAAINKSLGYDGS